jgi:hypothetical protein
MENTENTAGTPFPPEPALAPEQPPTPSKNAFERVIGIFFEPDAVFADIARSPGFILPLVLVILCSAGTATVMVNRIDMRDFMAKQLEKNPRTESMPAAQKEQAIENGAKFTKFAFFATPVFVPISMLVIAGILMVMANFVFGGTATFKQLFSVVAHAQMVGIILGILIVVILFLKDPSDVDLQNPIASNLGMLIPIETSKFLHRLAVSLDIFSFWQMYLLGSGAAICGRLSKAKGIMAIGIPWFIYVLVVSGLATLQ